MHLSLSKLFPVIFIINFLVDFIFYLQEDSPVLSLLRIVLNITFVGIVLWKNKISSKKLFSPLFMILFYSLFFLLFSSDLNKSFIEFTKFASTILFLPVAYYLINTREKLIEFLNSVYILLPLYTFFVVVSNFYDIGSIRYSNEDTQVFRVALGDAKLYAPAILVGMLPILIKNNFITKKKFYSLIGIMNFFLLLLTIRRTAIFIIIFIPLAYYFISGNMRLIFRFMLAMVLLVLVSYPLFETQLNERLSERDYLLEDSYSYKSEGRYLELGAVLKTFYESDSVFTYLFGQEAFNTIGNYGFYNRDRPIHSDYIYILFSLGIIGFLLYLSIFVKIFIKLKSIKLQLYLLGLKSDYSLCFVLFIMIIVLGVSGNIWAITFKSFSFGLLGAYLGYLNSSTDNLNLDMSKL